MKRIAITFLCGFLSASSLLKADEPFTDAIEVFKGYDIYATTIVREDSIWKQWFAGWMSESDKPWDRMYYSFSGDSGETWSTPVEVFTIENVQVNDPSVLRLWDSDNSRYYYLMYYTYYPSGLGDPTNYIAASTSLDGLDWTHHGVLIGANNGVDTDGAWAPSALATDSLASEVYLYFHNNHPDGQIFRTTLANKGMDFDPASTTAVTSPGGLRANPDVSRSPDGTWWMFYNGSSVTSGGKGNFNTRKMYSDDGINWRESGLNPIQEYADMTTTTPHVVWTGPGTYQLWYGYGTPTFLDFEVYRQDFRSLAEPQHLVVASSEALEVLGAPMAMDGNPQTFWSSAGHAGSGMHTEWIYLNLGEAREISVLELTPRVAEGAAMCFPLDFKLQHSSDAIEWTDIDGQSYSDYRCSDTLNQHFRFENIISDSFFRLYATSLSADSYGNFYCQIAEMEVSLDTTSTGIKKTGTMESFDFIQSYPNPFRHTLTISYTLKHEAEVSLSIFDSLGRKVGEIVKERQASGYYKVDWSGPSGPTPTQGNGLYLIRFSVDDQVLTRRIIQFK